MAGSYYVKTTVKSLLDIASADTAEDTLLDLLGGLADKHIDNILKIHDEKIPRQGTNVDNDMKMAANFYATALYKGRREQPDSAKFWMDQFEKVIEGIKAELKVENQTYSVERFMGRGTHPHDHQFAEWA